MGPSACGKTEQILNFLGTALNKGRQCYVIVPEQQSIEYETLLCNRFGSKVNLNCEVLNFERLPNRIAREYGNLAISNIDKGGACALLSLISEVNKDNLKEYSAVAADNDFANSLYSLISRMKMALITPDDIRTKSQSPALDNEPRLRAKLQDIALIYSEYEKHFADELNDPRDALTRLAQELPAKPFFKNTCVFIDGYYTFTGQEYKIIEEIIAQSANTYITFNLDVGHTPYREFFAENASCCQRVGKLAKGDCDDIYLSGNKRTSSATLKHIQNNIWENDAQIVVNDGSLRMITAVNRFDEVEAAAAQILEFVMEGNRFSDIAVLASNTDTYSTIVDSVFSRAGIPCFMSAKEPISAKPLFSFLISSILVITEDFSLRSIKRYIKSGFSGLTNGESDALLNYATSWKLRGKAWYSQSDWTLNPEGYQEGDISNRGAKQLAAANTARYKIVEPLMALRESLKSKDLTVSKAVRALYTHAISMSADEILRQRAERILKNSDKESSDREIQLWKFFINIINQLDSLCGNHSVTPKRFLTLFRLMCDSYSLGAIPASKDAVTFGSPALLRAGGKKMVLILGVTDGEFPSAVSMGGFFDKIEASLLEGVDLVIADTMTKQLNTARFHVYAAFSAPTTRLLLLCPGAELAGGELRPSTAWLSVSNMVGKEQITAFTDKNLLYSAESIAASFPNLEDSPLKDKIATALINNGISYTAEYPQITDTESKINYKDDILKLSPTKFETYIKCPFSYFGQYVLGLKKKKINEFSMSEIGSFAHKILDMFMQECVSTGKFVAPDPNQRTQLLNRLTDEYLNQYIGAEARNDKQFMHICNNMVKTLDFVTENLCEEFTESRFIPSGFEFKIGLTKEPDIPAIQYDIDGKTVTLRGSIDRVDTYTKNGVTYVRVIDYKTYGKEFSADLVACGMDTQLLHYLFAYCEKTGGQPAGALYYKVIMPSVDFTGSESESELKEALRKSLTRSGIMLDDPEIAFAMSPTLSDKGSSTFVPVGYSKKDKKLTTRKKSKVLYTAEDFQTLSQELKEQVTSLADNVFCGNMDIAPNTYENKVEPCKYCPLGNLCRSKKDKEEEDFETDTSAS